MPSTMQEAPQVIVQLKNVSVNVTGGAVVLTGRTGFYEIDDQRGFVHVDVGPPANTLSGGPKAGQSYVVSATTADGKPVKFVGLNFGGETKSGVYRFSHNLGRLEAPPEGSFIGTETPATDLRIASQRKRTLAATAPTGVLLRADGHPSQLIADNVRNQPGMSLEVGSLYSISGEGIPTKMNMQFDHVMQATDGRLFVFFEIVAESCSESEGDLQD